MSVLIGPDVAEDSVTFRMPDAEPDAEPDAGPTLAGVRLLPALSLLPIVSLDFAYTDGEWRLALERPPVDRMEYRFQLHHPDGGVEEICDPNNPIHAPGAFGDKSVVEFPGYAAPAWLAASPVPGAVLDVAPHVQVWTPDEPEEPLPLLVAHDGPEYDRLAGLTQFVGALIHAQRLPPCRVALLAPDQRNEEYSANPDHSAALHDEILPALRDAVAVRGPVVGMGASLGGLAMLHAQRAHPGLFGGLFLQSASFLDAQLDPQEEGRFDKFEQVTTYVARVVEEGSPDEVVPVTLTCGLAEENLANNRQMTGILAGQGYPARLVEVPDAHNYVGWRDAFDPALADLLTSVWEG